MAEDLGNLQVRVGADIAAFEAGMARVQADLGQVAAAAASSSGRYADAQGKMREANGRFVSSATLAAEAARNVGGSLGTLSDSANKAASSINGGLVASFGRFDAAVKPLNEGVGRLGEGLKGFGGTLTAAVTLPLGLLGGASLKMAGDLEVAKVAFTTMLGSAEAATATLNDLKQFAADTPFEFPEIQEAAKKLLAFNTPATELKGTLRELGDISAGIGAPIGEIAELFGKARVQGRLFQEDINQLTGRGIPIIQELAKQFNVTEDGVRKLVESGKVNFGNLQTAFADLTKEGGKFGGLMAAQSQTLPGLFSTLSDTAGQALGSLGEDIAKSLNLKALILQVSDFIKGAADAFRSLSPAAKDFAIGVGVAAAAIGPIVFGLGSVLAILPQITAGFATLGIGSVAALGPLLPIAAGVALAALLIYENWDSVVSYFKGPAGDVFRDLGDSIAEAFSAIASALRDLVAGPIGQAIAAIGKLALALGGGALAASVAVISSAISLFAGNLRIVTDLFRGDFQKALADGAQTAENVAKPFRDLLGLGQTKSAAFSDFFKDLLPNARAAGDAVDYFSDELVKAGAQVGLLQKLKDELKAVQEQRDKESTVTAINADTARIKSLQAQIAALEGTGKASAKATDAIAKLRQELARLGALDKFLGNAPSEAEVLDRRITALTGGLKSLVDAGVSTSSRAFRGFALDLVNTSQALEKLRGAGQSLDLKPVDVKSLIPATIGDTLDADVARLLGDFAQKTYVLPLHLEIKPIEGTITDFTSTIQDGVTKLGVGFTKELDSLSKGLRVADSSLAVFGGSFDVAGAKAQALQQSLNNLLAAGVSPLSPEVQALAASYQQVSAQSQLFQLATQSAASGLSALGEAIGGALASGADVFQAILGALLGALGDFVIKYGQTVILKGIADIALGNVGQGALEIAGGTALIAGGAALKGVGGAAPSGGGAGGSVAAPATTTGSNSATSQQKITVVAEFKLHGADLVAVGRVAGYRELRTR